MYFVRCINDTSEFTKKADLACLKIDADKLGIDELKAIPTCLNNLKADEDKLVITELQTILPKISYIG